LAENGETLVKPARTRGQGFTLIELLVVVALIAILAAILFPVFAKARDKARQVGCFSNQKQIVTALLLYGQDYDEHFPGGKEPDYWMGVPGPEGSWEALPVVGDRNGTASARISIPRRLLPYHKNTQIFVCPSDPTGDTCCGTPKPYDGRFTRRSYIWSLGLSFGWSHPNWPSTRGRSDPHAPITLAEVRRPSLLWTTTEFVEFHSRFRRGEARVNRSFADGHVQFGAYVDEWVPGNQRSEEWDYVNPRDPVDPSKPCVPTCAEEAVRD
jgi:prepilin-type N-terminal cleavage/methylation domain-containing protein/prepilin-type processing-associated H-X9-DG protein